MDVHCQLKSMLKELIPFIEGEWFLGDGGLLGIVRDKNLIPWDDDLDIYLLPKTTINFNALKESSLNYNDYYKTGKIYRPNNETFKKNSWLEYMSFVRGCGNTHLNRCKLMQLAKESYIEYKETLVHTRPWIDIFTLKEKDQEGNYHINHPMWYDYYFTDKEIKSIGNNNNLGFNVKIPYDNKEMLQRFYGNDWFIYKPNFMHF